MQDAICKRPERTTDTINDPIVALRSAFRDSGDALHALKLLAIACTDLPHVRRDGESIGEAAASLLLSTLAVVAAELTIDRAQLLRDLALAYDQVADHLSVRQWMAPATVQP